MGPEGPPDGAKVAKEGTTKIFRSSGIPGIGQRTRQARRAMQAGRRVGRFEEVLGFEKLQRLAGRSLRVSGFKRRSLDTTLRRHVIGRKREVSAEIPKQVHMQNRHEQKEAQAHKKRMSEGVQSDGITSQI